MNADVKSAARVLDVLELFATADDPLGVTQVARSLEIPKSSAQGLLVTLARRGYLTRLDVGYVLPPELRNGGWVGGARARLLALARPVLERMSRQSGESAFLGVLAGNQIRYLAKSLSSHEVRYDASLSQARPVYCTSIGIVMLAHQGEKDARNLLARTVLRAVTPHTVTDRDAIHAMLDRARRQGYAELQDANVMGASGVSAPVFGPGGEVIAGISIGAPTTRYKQMRRQLIGIVVEEVAALSKRMSGHAAERQPGKGPAAKGANRAAGFGTNPTQE
jgi:DNA-binding IclR family transcriptional regulator